MGLPPERFFSGVFHRTCGSHPDFAGALNTVNSNHFQKWVYGIGKKKANETSQSPAEELEKVTTGEPRLKQSVFA